MAIRSSFPLIMLRLITISCLCGFLQAQYSAQGGQQQSHFNAPQQTYAPASRQTYAPAPVHYVNIGAQLQGDYKFGYDTGKGPEGQSFREETRLPDGSVQGAYGYVDATGKQRIIKYSAGAAGFVAEGDLGPAGAPKAAAPRQASQQAAVPQTHVSQQQSYNSGEYNAPASYEGGNTVYNGAYNR